MVGLLNASGRASPLCCPRLEIAPSAFPSGLLRPTCPWRGAPEAASFGLRPGTRRPSSHTDLLLARPCGPWSSSSHPAPLPTNSPPPAALEGAASRAVGAADLMERGVWGRTAGSLASDVGLVLEPHPLQTDGGSDSPAGCKWAEQRLLNSAPHLLSSGPWTRAPVRSEGKPRRAPRGLPVQEKQREGPSRIQPLTPGSPEGLRTPLCWRLSATTRGDRVSGKRQSREISPVCLQTGRERHGAGSRRGWVTQLGPRQARPLHAERLRLHRLPGRYPGQ